MNLINDPHTFTTTVFVDDGMGTDLDGVMGTVIAKFGHHVLCVVQESLHMFVDRKRQQPGGIGPLQV